jgi:hypothetical protein
MSDRIVEAQKVRGRRSIVVGVDRATDRARARMRARWARGGRA